MNRLLRFLRYPPGRKLLLLEALLRLGWATLLVHLLPSSRIARMCVRPPRPWFSSGLAGFSAAKATRQDISWAITTVARYLPGAVCLPQSLAGRAMLHSAGYPAEIRLGVARTQPGFQAHAWVCSEGSIVLGESEIAYAELPKVR